jgi:enamine deaminase RidA (YjgF/YER057c/UK114 family)
VSNVLSNVPKFAKAKEEAKCPSSSTIRQNSTHRTALIRTQQKFFEEQGEIIWTHIGTLLKAAGMDYENIVSLRTYLADPQDDEANVQLRMKYLGDHQTASTVICCRLLDPKWKLEVEAMAAN